MSANMTTWINSQFPRPDFHRQAQRHYGLQDTGFPLSSRRTSVPGLRRLEHPTNDRATIMSRVSRRERILNFL